MLPGRWATFDERPRLGEQLVLEPDPVQDPYLPIRGSEEVADDRTVGRRGEGLIEPVATQHERSAGLVHLSETQGGQRFTGIGHACLLLVEGGVHGGPSFGIFD